VAPGAWVDPGFVRGRSRLMDGCRLLWQLIQPPRGHLTWPTRSGWMLIGVSLAVGSAAFNTGNNILYLGLALLLSSLMLSGLLAWFNLMGCRWRFVAVPPAQAGSEVRLQLEVANHKRWLPTLALGFTVAGSRAGDTSRMDEVDDEPPEIGTQFVSSALPPGGRVVLVFPWVPAQRGRYRVELASIHSRFPFGFLRKSIRGSLAFEQVVWPARRAYVLNARPPALRFVAQSKNRGRGDGVEIHRLRAWQPGDGRRMIHWRTTARTGRLWVRETLADTTWQLVVSLVGGADWTAASWETAVGVAYAVGDDLAARHQLAGWIDNEGVMRTIETVGGLRAWRDWLATVRYDQPWRTSAEFGARHAVVQFAPADGGHVVLMINGERAGESR
jgi:uncharacterized protein (DUF58 family)